MLLHLRFSKITSNVSMFSTVKASFNSVIWLFRINRGLSFFKGVEIHRKDFQINVLESTDLNVQLELLGKHINPLFIQHSVKNEEISIV